MPPLTAPFFPLQQSYSDSELLLFKLWHKFDKCQKRVAYTAYALYPFSKTILPTRIVHGLEQGQTYYSNYTMPTKGALTLGSIQCSNAAKVVKRKQQ